VDLERSQDVTYDGRDASSREGRRRAGQHKWSGKSGAWFDRHLRRNRPLRSPPGERKQLYMV
jgi:hypothetical protein